jgi:hypothetical protein
MLNNMASKAVVWERAEPPQPDIPLAPWGVGPTRVPMMRSSHDTEGKGIGHVTARSRRFAGRCRDRRIRHDGAQDNCRRRSRHGRLR